MSPRSIGGAGQAQAQGRRALVPGQPEDGVDVGVPGRKIDDSPCLAGPGIGDELHVAGPYHAVFDGKGGVERRNPGDAAAHGRSQYSHQAGGGHGMLQPLADLVQVEALDGAVPDLEIGGTRERPDQIELRTSPRLQLHSGIEGAGGEVERGGPEQCLGDVHVLDGDADVDGGNLAPVQPAGELEAAAEHGPRKPLDPEHPVIERRVQARPIHLERLVDQRLRMNLDLGVGQRRQRHGDRLRRPAPRIGGRLRIVFRGRAGPGGGAGDRR